MWYSNQLWWWLSFWVLCFCVGYLCGEVAVKKGKILVDTANYKLVFDKGVLVNISNKLTGENYSIGGKFEKLTGLLWVDRKAWVEETRNVKVEKTGANSAKVVIDLGAGGELVEEVMVDSVSGDLLVRQYGRGDRGGLYGASWGIGCLNDRLVDIIAPVFSGCKLTKDSVVAEQTFQWPLEWEAQMVIVQGRRGGFWVWNDDEACRFKALYFRHGGDTFGLGLQSHNFAPFDELKAVEGVEWRLNVYGGDWMVAARRYRDWLEKTYGLKYLGEQQAWVKNIKFCVIMSTHQEELLDELAKQVNPGQTLLYIPDWRKFEYDRNYPNYTAHNDFGTFVEHAHSLGFYVMVHVNYFGVDAEHELYEKFEKHQMRDPFSKERLWWLWERAKPAIKFAYINPAYGEWRKTLIERLKEVYAKYKVDAFHLDQTLCIFNDANGLIDGLSCAQGNILLHKELHEALPEVALSGEGLDEVTLRYEAFSQRHGWGVNYVDASWDDKLIDLAHPVSSFLFLPYNVMYGYLGMPNPGNARLFRACRRDYESFGIIPTYAWPSVEQLREPTLDASILLKEAKFWAAEQLEPKFDEPWGEGVKFLYVTKSGERVVCAGEDGGSVFYKENKGKEIIYQYVKVKGCDQV